MKRLNKKGFTLIELLAVIVILALLIAVAIPAVTRYLNTARRGTLASSANAAISAVRNDYLENGYTADKTYTLAQVNGLLEKKLEKSPFNNALYDEASFVKVTFTAATDTSEATTTYHVCLKDANGAGINQDETAVKEANVKTTGITCTAA